MKKLNKKQFYHWLKSVEEMVEEEHDETNVQILLADLYCTISECYLWQLPEHWYQEWRLNKAVKKHKNCCDL